MSEGCLPVCVSSYYRMLAGFQLQSSHAKYVLVCKCCYLLCQVYFFVLPCFATRDFFSPVNFLGQRISHLGVQRAEHSMPGKNIYQKTKKSLPSALPRTSQQGTSVSVPEESRNCFTSHCQTNAQHKCGVQHEHQSCLAPLKRAVGHALDEGSHQPESS
jgi:hypothetical protein